MVNVCKHGLVLEKRELIFESEGVLNPAVIAYNGGIHMFYRAVRSGNFSTLGHCIFSDPLTLSNRSDEPVLWPQDNYEAHGIEDPRIVRIEGLFYLTYTAYDGVNATGALATSTDLSGFQKHGVILPRISYEAFHALTSSDSSLNEKYARYNFHEGVKVRKGRDVHIWDKNLMFFPRRIRGRLYFLHRVKPDIQIASVESLAALTEGYWEAYFSSFSDHILLTPRFEHEVSYIGGGCPPIETSEGWLLIYHAVHDTLNGYMYVASAALLSLEEPERVRATLPHPLFVPDQEWELNGVVKNVCFPTGAVQEDDTLYIYYGAADAAIACASLSMAALLAELLVFEIK